MATVIKAVWENGVFKPEEPVELAERAQVRLLIQPAGDGPSASWQAWQDIIGIADDPGSPTDVAENHDHYLYGASRKR